MAEEKDYESRIIGGFIYLMGVEHGQRQPREDAKKGWVDLFQQTPLDTQWGDLIAQSDSRYVLIEFKRSESLVRKEFEKDHREKLLKELKKPEMLMKWAGIHYIAYGSTTIDFPVTFQPYALIKNQPLQPAEERTSLAEFLDRLITQASVGRDIETFEAYLREVAEHAKGTEGSEDGGVAISVNKGKLAAASYSSIAGFSDLFEETRLQIQSRSTEELEQSLAPGESSVQEGNSEARRQQRG